MLEKNVRRIIINMNWETLGCYYKPILILIQKQNKQEVVCKKAMWYIRD